MDKPIIVVYDGDASILEDMKEECAMCCANDSPVEVHRLLDILMNYPIQWLKEGVFSAESLKLVYFHLFRNLPFYRDINKRHLLDKGLRMPNDFVNVPLPSSIELLVCEANDGACDLAIEIQRQEPEKITIKTLRDITSSPDDRNDSPKSIFPTVCGIDDIGSGLQDEAAEDNRSKSILNIFPIKGTFPESNSEKGSGGGGIHLDDMMSVVEEGLSLRSTEDVEEVGALIIDKDVQDDLSEDMSLEYSDTNGEADLPLLHKGFEGEGEVKEDHYEIAPKAPEQVGVFSRQRNNYTKLADAESDDNMDNDLSFTSKPAEETIGRQIHLNDIAVASRSWKASITLKVSALKNSFFETAPKQILLLYLHKDTFSSAAESSVAASVKAAKQKGISIILVHEQDIDKGGCPFSYFFKNTPAELIDSPFTIYKDIAIPLYSREEYRQLSLSLILNMIGSEEL